MRMTRKFWKKSTSFKLIFDSLLKCTSVFQLSTMTLGLSGGALCLSFMSPALGQEAPKYIASEIPHAQDAGYPFFADMDGDGTQDLLLEYWSIQQGRELHIYLQQSDGRFPPEPSRRVEIKPEIIAVATAELGNNPGDELIFLTSDAVYSFSSAIASYSGNVQKLFDWPLIATTPHRKKLVYLGR